MTPTIVDTHTHVVSLDRSRYPVQPPAGLPRLNWFDEHPVDAAALLTDMDKAGVHAAVLVQAKGAYGFDNSYAADARAAAPDRFVSASIIDMEAADRIEQLTYWAIERGMLGTRLFNIPPAAKPWLNDPATRGVFDRVRELGIRVNLCTLVDDVPLVGALAELAGDVPIAFDHCGFTDFSGGPPYHAAAPLFALAPHRNLRFKVTTTLLEPARHPGGDPRDLVEHLCGVFGVERLLWGSDYPQHHSEPYPEIVELARYACSRLTPSEQARFLGDNALELWPEVRP